MNKYKFSFLLFLCCLGVATAQEVSFDENTYYRLTNAWMGEGRSLDVNPEGLGIVMAPTGNYSGQLWKITHQGEGYYKLSCQWQGEGKVIDVINDGNNNRMALVDNANYSGQFWVIESAGEGYYRLINAWQTEKSLDCDGDKNGYGAWLNPTGKYGGQFWKITDTADPATTTDDGPIVNIGDKVHGGIVFFVDRSGKHGLLCQEEDFDKLMSFSEAQGACESSTHGGKNDWRLPTLDELSMVYNNLRKSNLHHFHNEWYWSSKVEDEHNMWAMDILHGQRFAHWEGDHSHVRGVRAF